MRKKALSFAILTTSLLIAFAIGQQARSQAGQDAKPPLPPARKIPGLNAADAFPKACVDCHVNHPEMKLDARLSTAMKRWTKSVEPKVLERAQACAPAGLKLQGKHPDVTAMVKDVPKGCLMCHGSSSKMAPPLAQMVHQLHLTGGDQNVFMTVYQGECTHCHKIDAAKGKWTVPSAPEKS